MKHVSTCLITNITFGPHVKKQKKKKRLKD